MILCMNIQCLIRHVPGVFPLQVKIISNPMERDYCRKPATLWVYI